jgi:AraC-like DNA-binding protein
MMDNCNFMGMPTLPNLYASNRSGYNLTWRLVSCGMGSYGAARLLTPFLPEAWEGQPADSDAMQRLRPALDRIGSGLAEECSVATLARHVNLHPVYFSRLFSRTLGISPGEYVACARMRRAAVQLTTTSLPVKAIGAACGYPDPYHFSRAFKRNTGISPTAYRQAQG